MNTFVTDEKNLLTLSGLRITTFECVSGKVTVTRPGYPVLDTSERRRPSKYDVSQLVTHRSRTKLSELLAFTMTIEDN